MYAFNPTTREEYKTRGDRSQAQSEDLWRQDHPLLAWLNPSICLWVFSIGPTLHNLLLVTPPLCTALLCLGRAYMTDESDNRSYIVF